jgi:hypothetical protein
MTRKTKKQAPTTAIPYNASGSYFAPLHDNPAMIDFLQENGMNALKESRMVYDKIYEDARKTLTFLLAGLGASFGYFVKLMLDTDTNNTLSRPALCIGLACFWLFICTVLLLLRCIRSNKLPLVHPLPKDLYTPQVQEMHLTLDELRLYNLDNIADRIDRHNAINQRVIRWLNRVRYMVAVTPFIALLPCIYGLISF